MNMGIMAQQIKRYRQKTGMTQEQLGAKIGVSKQAISKWECGGLPDADTLPLLADALHISVDTLFGREEIDISSLIACKLCHVPESECSQLALTFCYAIAVGLLRNESATENFLKVLDDTAFMTSDGNDYYIKLMQDKCIVNLRLSADFKQFFVMTEPNDGLKARFSDTESLRGVLGIFADKRLFSIICYMYSRRNTPIFASLISKVTEIPLSELEECMDILHEHHLVDSVVVATVDGMMKAYMFRQENSVIPLLSFADQLAKPEHRDVIAVFERNKPLL